MYQYKLLDTWDRTTRIAMAFSDGKTSFESLHPFRNKSLGRSASIKVEPRALFKHEEFRNGERISILRQMVGRDAEELPIT